jgi:molybdopterin-guanine dinucleotide biosynthesis protein A
VVPDRIPDCGPLGGLFTALSSTGAGWNLLVACDMPALTADVLRRLIADAAECGTDALVPRIDGRWEPLCAVYHRRLGPAAESAIRRKCFKMQDFVSQIRACPWPAPDPYVFRNVNTPEEFKAVLCR